jgi:hypothetical protein
MHRHTIRFLPFCEEGRLVGIFRISGIDVRRFTSFNSLFFFLKDGNSGIIKILKELEPLFKKAEEVHKDSSLGRPTQGTNR